MSYGNHSWMGIAGVWIPESQISGEEKGSELPCIFDIEEREKLNKGGGEKNR